METFTSLQTLAHDATQTESSDTEVNTFLKNHINRTYEFMLTEMRVFNNQVVKTSSTVADQQFYHKPPGVVTIESVKVSINNVDYVLEPVHSQTIWDEINAVTFTGTAIPRYFFQRQLDLGIFPTPQTSGYTITMTYYPRYTPLSKEDLSTGLATVLNNNKAVSFDTSILDGTYQGLWFKIDSNGEWYKIESVTGTQDMNLTNVYQGSSKTGVAYTIGDSPNLPEETHQLLVYGAARDFFIFKRKDPTMATFWNNMFFTGDPQNSSREPSNVLGGLIRAKERYSKRSDTGTIRRKSRRSINALIDKNWATVIS